MSVYINTNHGTIYEGCQVTIHQGQEPIIERREPVTEEVEPINTSFFCTDRFTADIIEKNIRQAIETASSKAKACRQIMALETPGYILLSNKTDEEKAKLINPFAAPRFTFCGQDFRQARNRKSY